ncbi:hypothetical protein F5H01DRAFT_315070 [Linnemannia elongata]|nr:hypothetical protein F5H01DRAFT_315070 [Linnemannia elongata]
MFTKAICIVVTGLSYALTATPPSSSRSVSESKDKIKVERRFIDASSAPYLLVALTLFETSAYLLLMYRARLGHNQDNAAMQQLGVLDSWHVVGSMVAVGAMLLRRWTYSALDRFFTYQLTIRPGHRLVKTGPYRLLLHPSYTGAVFNATAVYMVLWYKGLWDVAAYYLARSIGYSAGFFTMPFGIDMGMLLPVLFGVFMAQMFLRRYKKEEMMLREHFGKEWDEYASKRWRFVPFIY